MGMSKPVRSVIQPETILSWHEASATLYWKNLYMLHRFDLIPPIPIVVAPEDADKLFSKAVKMLNCDCPKETCVWCDGK